MAQQKGDVTDPLSLDAITAAMTLREQTGNNVPLSSLLAIAFARANSERACLMIQNSASFDTVIDDTGTTPLDYLAQCTDEKLVTIALHFCTVPQKALFEQKKKSNTAAHPPVAKLSDRNFHKESSSAGANRGGNNPDNAGARESKSCVML